MTLKKILTLLLVAILCLGFAACGQTGGKTDTSAAQEKEDTVAKKLDPVTLKIYIPGDKPAAMDDVVAEAEKRMADSVNAKLDIIWMPWSEITNKISVTMSSGEPVDLMFDKPDMGMPGRIKQGLYEPLDDLLDKYGQNILKVRPKVMWDANMYGDKKYCIPLGATHGDSFTFYVRKDIRENLGFQPIKSLDELIKFAYLVRENDKNIVPITCGDTNFGFRLVRWDYDMNIKSAPGIAPENLIIYLKQNDGKVYNLLDTKEPKIMEALSKLTEYYKGGLFGPSPLAMNWDEIMNLMKSGGVAIAGYAPYGVLGDVQSSLKAAVPGAEYEEAIFDTLEPKKWVSDFAQWNFILVPKTAKNKERAIMFLDWANAAQENYDLLAYGIEGKQWKMLDDGRYQFTGSDYRWFPYDWIWNPVQDRIADGLDAKALKHEKAIREADFFIPSALTGFHFDQSPVQNEVAHFNSIYSTIWKTMSYGAVSPEDALKQLESEAGDTIRKITADYQKQIDAFLKK